jgi:hypothetical protein
MPDSACPLPPRDVAALILKKSRSLLRQPPNFDPSLSARHRLWNAKAESRSLLNPKTDFEEDRLVREG